MIDRSLRITPNFSLGELIPPGCDFVPANVLVNLEATCALAEIVRAHFNLPMQADDAYRPPTHNAAVGGSKTSDHLEGRALDFKMAAGHGMTWEANTKAAFLFIVDRLKGKFGQVILEDQRDHYADRGKLWVHLAIPSTKHPGFKDASAVLLSPAPHVYEAWPPGSSMEAE